MRRIERKEPYLLSRVTIEGEQKVRLYVVSGPLLRV
jgi:hypothetical protein